MTIREAVDWFQDLVSTDEVLQPCLAAADRRSLARHQAAFLTEIHNGRQLEAAVAVVRAYHGLVLTAMHVQHLGAHAITALREAGADDTVLAAVWSVLTVVHEDLTTSEGQAPVPTALPTVQVRRRGSHLPD